MGSNSTSSNELGWQAVVLDADETVRLGSALEQTTGASISSPDSRTTPVALRCPSFLTFADRGLRANLAAPASSAMRCNSSVIAPMPPRTKPHAPEIPVASPKAWCRKTYALPGVRGPAAVPMIPCDAMKSTHHVGLEVLLAQLGDRPVDGLLEEPFDLRVPERAPRLLASRRIRQERPQPRGRLLEQLLELRIGLGVGGRELLDLLGGLGPVGPQAQAPAVLEGRERVRDPSSGCRVQPQFLDDLGAEEGTASTRPSRSGSPGTAPR